MGTGEGEHAANQCLSRPAFCRPLLLTPDERTPAIRELPSSSSSSQRCAWLISLTPLPAVLLLSLRAQLQLPSGSTKPSIITTYNSDAESNSRCNAVQWIPKTEGTMFASAHANGTVLIYKKVGGRLWRAVARAAGAATSQALMPRWRPAAAAASRQQM
jgi:hypothetical protein